MKKLILLLPALIFGISALAETNAFLVKENGKVLVSEGDCQTRHAPRCSFNFAISLMAYNEGLLTDETHPEFSLKPEYPDVIGNCKKSINPELWIKNSCTWYSRVLTKQLGMSKFQEYVKKFYYGNKDVSGDKGKNNGLTHSWLASLSISPEEQTVFIQNLLDQKFDISSKSYEMTKRIFLHGELADGWHLYGKTGTGNLRNKDGSIDEKHQGGWFVGWIEKDERTIVFADYFEQETSEIPAGRIAKETAKDKLLKIIK